MTKFCNIKLGKQQAKEQTEESKEETKTEHKSVGLTKELAKGAI